MDSKQLEQLRHSAAHLLAHAVIELYPDTILTIGPATPEGFFYDMLPKHNFKEEDLPKIEARMHEISKKNYPITHTQIPKDEARKIFVGNPYKLELIDQIPGQTVGLSQQGNFYDLCRGGHVESTGDIKHFKLQNISGSYWRADRSAQALQRISGTAFGTAQELADYEKRKEEAALYDHRRLGKLLDLFSFRDEGVGFAFIHPKGKRILNVIVDYLRKQLQKNDFEEIQTPILLNDELWKTSGHYAHYKDNMYFCTIDERQYAVKPMNCPGAILVYKDHPRSYRELPLRLAEFGLVHRHELSGVLQGLFRVRAFTQDDAHIFCTPDQIESEIISMITLNMKVLEKFGFNDINIAIATRPEKSMGNDDLWKKGTDALMNALKHLNLPYTVNEGDGAFYGPKIEFNMKDSMGRLWQCGTIQVDFCQSENFDLSYIAPSGAKERPVILHRVIYGSLERFFGILIEHYKGNFPFWLAPVQVKVLTITDDQKEFAHKLAALLKENDVRVEVDETSDPISGKIKTAQTEKVPWMAVLGKKEVENNTVTLRNHDGKQEFAIPFDAFTARAVEANK